MSRPQSTVLDELLVLQSQGGDAEAWATLVGRWHGRLLARALRLLGNPHDATDATQDAWASIARALHRLDDPALFGPWAYRILTRRCADLVRRSRRQPRSVSAPEATAQGAREHEPDEIASLRASLDRLPPEQRLLLAMHYADGLELRVIAEILRVPVGTVKSRLHHAREALRALLPESAQPKE
ncbi:MAG: RNA polymerase sigma factor [Phycisphaerales bacterium]|nr:RNA polymerase sigma factor [Phycisphaerales bacterium]